jgi:hypothetical protein
MTDCCRRLNPCDPSVCPQALTQAKQEYLIEHTLKGALRHLYGDQAVRTTARIAKALAHELVKKGVMIVPFLAFRIRTGLVQAMIDKATALLGVAA